MAKHVAMKTAKTIADDVLFNYGVDVGETRVRDRVPSQSLRFRPVSAEFIGHTVYETWEFYWQGLYSQHSSTEYSPIVQLSPVHYGRHANYR